MRAALISCDQSPAGGSDVWEVRYMHRTLLPVSVALTISLGLGAPAPANAADAAPEGITFSHADELRAREQIQKGRRLYDLGQFKEAIGAFEEAYKLTDNPAILYNLAQAHRRLQSNAKAIDLYETYLRRTPDAQNREEVENRIATLRTTLAPPNGLALGDGAPATTSPIVPSAPAALSLRAPPPAPATDSAFHRHDGFFMRSTIGPQFVRASSARGESFSEPGLGMSWALGGAVSDNWVLFGEMTYAQGDRGSLMTGQTSVTVGSFGVGVAYYLLPLNAHLSASFGMGFVDFDHTTSNGGVTTTTGPESDVGIGGHLTIGKEWWVSKNWGLGVAAEASFARARVDDEVWNGTTFGLSFTATFN